MKTYPICLINMSERRVLVIGGGLVALRNVRGLLDAQASLQLISPIITKELEELSRTGKLVWQQRDYRPGDLAGVFLVIVSFLQTKSDSAGIEDVVNLVQACCMTMEQLEGEATVCVRQFHGFFDDLLGGLA